MPKSFREASQVFSGVEIDAPTIRVQGNSSGSFFRIDRAFFFENGLLSEWKKAAENNKKAE